MINTAIVIFIYRECTAVFTIYKNPLLKTHKIKITCPQTECFTYPLNGHWCVVHINIQFVWPKYVIGTVTNIVTLELKFKVRTNNKKRDIKLFFQQR